MSCIRLRDPRFALRASLSQPPPSKGVLSLAEGPRNARDKGKLPPSRRMMGGRYIDRWADEEQDAESVLVFEAPAPADGFPQGPFLIDLCATCRSKCGLPAWPSCGFLLWRHACSVCGIGPPILRRGPGPRFRTVHFTSLETTESGLPFTCQGHGDGHGDGDGLQATRLHPPPLHPRTSR